ncbi:MULTISPECIES: pseudouridine synthase [unclassified Azospirillum]|uniref:pseudouridine synthase n=1 Tax=unclassified Azospirillum TaxID=2630922 RepID=UPI000B6DF736|nr:MULTISPECIES: pseudouridine synthase [unclassified Azospirillum]SNS40723.1 23S rRNA pseudouridine2605 synthase [Azospirillum sp. RU38E]SNS59296.1 23S rRNA pseudouridine2605 synthase [Azospirillum sp. RU37A]
MSRIPYDPLHQVAVEDVADDAETTDAAPLPGGERVAKRLARAGVCSRRDAEKLIADRRVSVNGRVLDSPAFLVRDGDRIVVDGKAVAEPEPTRLWRYHKPEGLVTTARDEQGRATVFDNLPGDLPRVVSVGRLDLSSEGLLLLTNDGELARFLELPSTGWLRRYRIRVHGTPTPETMRRLAEGVVVDGIAYGPIETVIDRTVGYNSWLTVGLREGKNREVRRVFDYLGLPVSRLIRVAYGPFQLGKLDRGQVEEVPRRVLREQIPDFFPADAVEPPPAPGAAPKPAPRMRYDRLPKAMAEQAPAAATKGGPRQAARPSAAKARDNVERMLGGKPKPARTTSATAAKPAAEARPANAAERRAAAAGLSESARKAVAAMDRALSKGDIPAEGATAPRRAAKPAAAAPKPASDKPTPAKGPRGDAGGKGANRRR